MNFELSRKKINLFLRQVSYWTLIYFISFHFIHLANEIIVIEYLLKMQNRGLSWLPLCKYLVLEFPESALGLLTLAIACGITTSCVVLRRRNYFLFIENRGINPRSILFRFSLFFCAAALFSFALDQTIAKDLRKAAEIVFEDELIRTPVLTSQFQFSVDKFLKLRPNENIYFEKGILDPLEKTEPILQGIIYWRQNSDGDDFLAVPHANLRGGDLRLAGIGYRLHQKKEGVKLSRREITGVHFTSPLLQFQKYPTVTPAALKLSELWPMLSAQKMNFAMYSLWGYFLLPFVTFMGIPIAILIGLWIFMKNRYEL